MKIVINGPESTGKTTLVEELSNHFDVDYLPEYARIYLEEYGPEYDESDLLSIAKSQHEIYQAKIKEIDTLIADTDLLNIKIWSEYKYGQCDPWIIKSLNENKPDLYLLCGVDIPWEFDTFRENPNDREAIYDIYLREIKLLEVPYNIIKGSRAERKKLAIEAIEILKSQP